MCGGLAMSSNKITRTKYYKSDGKKYKIYAYTTITLDFRGAIARSRVETEALLAGLTFVQRPIKISAESDGKSNKSNMKYFSHLATNVALRLRAEVL